MNNSTTKTLKFSINNWTHLYSLEQAILRAEEVSGKSLKIEGKIRNDELLENKDTTIMIRFYQVDATPNYQRAESGAMILGSITRTDNHLEANLPVDDKVFEELRKNLMEYVDIDGIHIIITLGLLISDKWQSQQCADIFQLDYAMRGDA